MERRLLLDVVVRERAAVLELLAREDQALLVGRDALLVLGATASRCRSEPRGSGTVDGNDRLARPSLLTKICMPLREAQHEVQRRLLLDVVVREHASVLGSCFPAKIRRCWSAGCACARGPRSARVLRAENRRRA